MHDHATTRMRRQSFRPPIAATIGQYYKSNLTRALGANVGRNEAVASRLTVRSIARVLPWRAGRATSRPTDLAGRTERDCRPSRASERREDLRQVSR